MSRKYIFFAPLAAVLIVAFVRPGTSPNNIVRVVEFNPGPIISQDCKPQAFTAFTNTTGMPANLIAVDLWMGLYRGAYADITLKVYRESDGMLITGLQQDRYSDPSGIHQRFVSFAPMTVPIRPGDSILVHGLNCFVGGSPSPMHPTVDLYFSN